MAYQTTANDDKFILGSAIIEVGTSVGTLASVGALTGIKVTADGESSAIEFDNAADITKKSLKGYMIEAEMAELDLTKIGTIFASPNDTAGTVAASIVNNHAYVIASGSWAYDTFIPYDYQNGDGSKITPDSVVGTTNATLVLDVDYTVVKNSDGIWGIVCTDASDGAFTTAAQGLTITYDYTPYASKTLLIKSSNYVPTTFVARITHTDDAGKDFVMLFYKCYSEEFFTVAFPKDGGTDIVRVPLKIKAVGDATDQIVLITDERTY
jgi:hypothetical protein